MDPAKPLGPLGHFTRAKVDWLPVHSESDDWVRTLTELGRGGADGKFGLGPAPTRLLDQDQFQSLTETGANRRGST